MRGVAMFADGMTTATTLFGARAWYRRIRMLLTCSAIDALHLATDAFLLITVVLCYCLRRFSVTANSPKPSYASHHSDCGVSSVAQ